MATSLQARYANLPASPAGLLGRFAPSGFDHAHFALYARISPALLAHISHFCAHKNFQKKKWRAKFMKIFEKKVCLNRLKML